MGYISKERAATITLAITQYFHGWLLTHRAVQKAFTHSHSVRTRIEWVAIYGECGSNSFEFRSWSNLSTSTPNTTVL